MRILCLILLMVFCLGSLTACGKKPSSLQPPDRKLSTYPRVYPDPKDSDY